MSNIEKDIKLIDGMVKEYNTFGDLDNPDYEDTDRIYKAIENILKKIKELEEQVKNEIKGRDILAKLNEESIPKQKVKEGLEDIEDYFDRLNGPDEDIEYIRNIKKELLEESK